jgi:hypothetical protein
MKDAIQNKYDYLFLFGFWGTTDKGRTFHLLEDSPMMQKDVEIEYGPHKGSTYKLNYRDRTAICGAPSGEDMKMVASEPLLSHLVCAGCIAELYRRIDNG